MTVSSNAWVATTSSIPCRLPITPREKIELLNQLKAEATGAQAEGDPVAFEPEEIDRAIAEVREGVESGVGTETVLKGDF